MKFEGTLDDINETQLKLLQDIFEKEGFSDCVVNISPVGKAGDNFVANVKRVSASNHDRTLSVVIKLAPTQEIFRNMTLMDVFFSNETVMYTKTLPKLVELQRAAGLDEECQLKFPKCYGAVTEAPYEMIVLEDLKVSGYEIADKLVSLTDSSIRLILKNLATLHSLSYFLKQKEPEAFNEIKNSLINMWAKQSENEEMFVAFQQMDEVMIGFLDTEEQRKRSSGALSTSTKATAELDKIDKNSEFSVILQGDCWTNNLMFKSEENKPVECIMIDYQVSRVSSPASDFLYLIFNTTDYETRTKHYTDWIHYYHKCLDDSLSNFNTSASSVYPLEIFEADLKRYGRVNYGLSLLLANILLRESSETIDMKTVAENNDGQIKFDISLILDSMSKKTVARIKQRIVGLYNSFVQFDYI